MKACRFIPKILLLKVTSNFISNTDDTTLGDLLDEDDGVEMKGEELEDNNLSSSTPPAPGLKIEVEKFSRDHDDEEKEDGKTNRKQPPAAKFPKGTPLLSLKSWYTTLFQFIQQRALKQLNPGEEN